ncbi:hypothetical protein T10_1000 [Trichinella papuae]|uniref:Uncharacterized protein n=1 Tax=Trichinella papuae TaxID=268474 RepID=A0A0V1M3S3_9BILA|nr:hypothetical protein T10_1000 [Trichinella papuae]
MKKFYFYLTVEKPDGGISAKKANNSLLPHRHTGISSFKSRRNIPKPFAASTSCHSNPEREGHLLNKYSQKKRAIIAALVKFGYILLLIIYADRTAEHASTAALPFTLMFKHKAVTISTLSTVPYMNATTSAKINIICYQHLTVETQRKKESCNHAVQGPLIYSFGRHSSLDLATPSRQFSTKDFHSIAEAITNDQTNNPNRFEDFICVRTRTFYDNQGRV